MRGKITPLAAVLLTLAAVGIVATLRERPALLIIPAAVFGIVYLLYRFPPDRFRKRRYRAPQPPARDRRKTGSGAGAFSRRKALPFRVIEGGRDDDGNRPKYH
ncbi:MAG: hypothetical protein A9Z00_04775 [Thermobacillus sp. ZCTH02-B1]|uniref:hypothetical protein n=1 Tax=Thermobacillus sp. ZCTH02-B1 TaxID=1858795 RepID=UPI000B575688|nr:hypothetical protein [Thermobacillus sp. ZCTH02-B1]OUM96887.1 MAG: hypothetical protein A9Z00_04775 [Thermobacillus sp. ZCTH02-B1]